MSPSISVSPNQRVILINEEGDRYFILFNEDGIAHTYSNFGHLGNHSIHTPDKNGEACEFVGHCSVWSRTTGPMINEAEIFQYLISKK